MVQLKALSRSVAWLAVLGVAWVHASAIAASRRPGDDARGAERLRRAGQTARPGVGDPVPAAPRTALRGTNPNYVPPILAWLAAEQNPSGSWGSSFEFADTATVVDALGRVQPAGALAFQNGAAWLTGQPALDNDELSRQILALDHMPGLDIDEWVDALLASRNAAEPNPAAPNYPEGGWGLASGFETDCLTTSLALLAVDAVGLAGGISEVSQPLAGSATNVHPWEVPAGAVRVRILISVSGSTVRLRMAQGAPPSPAAPYFPLAPGTYNIVFPDSGLPFTPGSNFISIESPNPPGQPATYSFAASYETADFDTRSLAEALAYLREAQNPDGGWGLGVGQSTSFYTTLHVMLALLAYPGYDFDTELAAGVNHVLSRQLPDGSFGIGATPVSYLTALATLDLLRHDVCPLGPDTQAAVDALLAMQDPDGSWEGEPYDTGLSLTALVEYDNDGDVVFRDGDCSGAEGDDLCTPGLPTGCDDNCRAYFNPDQNPVVFGQTIRAANKVSFTWPAPADVVFVRGLLSNVGVYGVNSAGVATGATALSTVGDVPASGSGFYYLIKLGGDCTTASWQSSLGVEPGRDLAPLGEVDVQITSPADGAVLTSSPVTVSGTVDGVDPVTVTVNGVAAGVIGANFNASVPLTRGLNNVTAMATDAVGFTGMDQITLRLVDHSIPRGSFATGLRVFTASSSTLDQTAFFTEQQSGVPAGVTYTTTSVTRISATEMRVGYRIDVSGGAATGIFDFVVEYGLLDASMQPLGPLSGNVFEFEIRVTP